MADHKPTVVKTDQEWKKILTDEEFDVIRMKGTEVPNTGEYNKFKPEGGYFACRACENPLYPASAKFDSGCGWPAFDKCYVGALTTEDCFRKPERKRIEIMCKKCGGHLGHVFTGERFTNTDTRHCVNSVSVRYVKEDPKDAPNLTKGLPSDE